MDNKWAYVAYAAEWYNPVMNNILAFIEEQNKKVTGKVTVSLYKGNIEVVAVESPFSMLKPELATLKLVAIYLIIMLLPDL